MILVMIGVSYLLRSEEHTSELQSLLESFKKFRLNYNMNKNIYTLSELMNELVVAEGILGTSSVDANMVEPSSSQPKSKGKVKRRSRTSPSKMVKKLP